MSSSSKQRWRENHPERYAAYERERAQARRNGYWGQLERGVEMRPCQSRASYAKYENGTGRMLQKMNWSRWGAGWRRIVDLPAEEQLQIALADRGLR